MCRLVFLAQLLLITVNCLPGLPYRFLYYMSIFRFSQMHLAVFAISIIVVPNPDLLFLFVLGVRVVLELLGTILDSV